MSVRAQTAATAVGALLVFAPAALGAPTLAADRDCYAAGRDVVALSGSGYTAGGEVALLLASENVVRRMSATAGPDGSFVLRAVAPTLAAFKALPPGFTLTITATDRARQGGASAEPSVASASVIVSERWVDVVAWNESAHVRPLRRTTFSAYGWTTVGSTLYAHFVRAGRVVRNVKLGALAGPCGSLTRRMRQFPFRPVRPGRYRVQFDTSASYRGTAAPFYVYWRVKVRRRDAVR